MLKDLCGEVLASYDDVEDALFAGSLSDTLEVFEVCQGQEVAQAADECVGQLGWNLGRQGMAQLQLPELLRWHEPAALESQLASGVTHVWVSRTWELVKHVCSLYLCAPHRCEAMKAE